MGNFINLLSQLIIPIIIVGIISYGLSKRVPVYDVFIDGAKNGFATVLQIMPTLVGLLVAVGVLRESGFLGFVAEQLGGFMQGLGLPPELFPLALVKMFSSSAATGLLLDIYKEYGTDSVLGTIASIMMSSTETIFYTMSVYFVSAKVSKTRWTLAGALCATLVGVVMSVILGK